MYIGIHTAGIPEAIAATKQRIILSLGLYNRFLSYPEIWRVMDSALRELNFRDCHVITVPEAARKGWVDDFMAILRPGFSAIEQEHELAASRDVLVRLAANHPGQINIYEARALSCTPIILVDDQIFFSQYCSSGTDILNGLWCSVRANTGKLFEWAQSGSVPESASPKELAQFRLVQECHFLMRNSKRMLL